MTGDPRVRRAALIRDQVLMQLEQGPTSARLLLHMVRHSVFGLVTEGHIVSALCSLVERGLCLLLGPLCRSCRYQGVDRCPRARRTR